MQHIFTHPQTHAQFRLIYSQPDFDREFYGRDHQDKLLTIAWNRGDMQRVTIDQVVYEFPSNAILCLMVNETFQFETPPDIVAWQFNRDFYCVVDHDKEVSCVGFLFYGSAQRIFVHIDERYTKQLDLLLQVFQDEFETADLIQGEMMLALLKRLIIIVTRLAKDQYIRQEELTSDKLDIVRRFNLLVENHYRSQHQVSYYADQLNRSPKTLSNLFALYNHKSPLQVIHERITLEARRLLHYTDKTSKEIAYELGFEDAAHFGKFFKKQLGQSPTDFKKIHFGKN